MTYKPEIDGLRAVAVLLVLFCHMHLGVPGGFIGVDIFFTISGFLITSILINGMESGKFGFANFYSRRLVRLYPALIVTVVLTFIAGFLLADPLMMETLVRSGKYAITSTSNLFFSKHLGYFDVAAQKQLFLHTWSLGVEWQFYLIWPVLIWLIYKLPLQCMHLSARLVVIVLLSAITIASIFASQWAISQGNDIAAYYLMPYRAFELGIGGLLVFIYPVKVKPAAGVALVAGGIGAILYAALVFTPQTAFPGYNALFPCLGIAACILGGKAFTKGNIFKWAPVVYIGKASYSMYLVHWPLVVMYTYYVFRPIRTVEKFTLVIASVLLGIIMYVLVEKRINFKRLSNIKGGIKTGIIAILVAIIAITAVFHHISRNGYGLPWRLSSTELDQQDYFNPSYQGYKPQSIIGSPQGQVMAVVAGDSFAFSYATGLDEYLSPANLAIKMISSPGCLLSRQYYRADFNATLKAECSQVYTQALQTSAQNNLPLIWIQSWDNYKIHAFNPLDSTSNAAPSNLPFNPSQGFANQADYDAFILQNLSELLSHMQGRKLILVAALPYYKIDFSEKECLARPTYLPNQACMAEFPQTYLLKDAITGHINALLETFAREHPNVYYVNPAHLACPDGICSAQRNAMIYNDGSHLSQYGSRQITPYVMDEIKRILALH